MKNMQITEYYSSNHGSLEFARIVHFLRSDKMKQIFESENIRYVEVSEQLLEDYLAMINDIENVARFIGDRTEAIPAEKELKWIHAKLQDKAPIFSMIEKAGGTFIGNIEFTGINGSEGELGIAITAKKQNMGYGTEAVLTATRYAMEHLGLDRVFLKVFPDNGRAIHVYEKCGFREYDRTDKDIFMEFTR